MRVCGVCVRACLWRAFAPCSQGIPPSSWFCLCVCLPLPAWRTWRVNGLYTGNTRDPRTKTHCLQHPRQPPNALQRRSNSRPAAPVPGTDRRHRWQRSPSFAALRKAGYLRKAWAQGPAIRQPLTTCRSTSHARKPVVRAHTNARTDRHPHMRLPSSSGGVYLLDHGDRKESPSRL